MIVNALFRARVLNDAVGWEFLSLAVDRTVRDQYR